MCMPDVPKQEASAQEIILAANARDRTELHQKVILPLEMEEIRRTQDPGLRAAKLAIAQGRGNAETRVAEDLALQTQRYGASSSEAGLSSNSNVAAAADTARTGAQQTIDQLNQAQGAVASNDLRDRRQLLQTGNNVARQVTSGLSTLANNATTLGTQRLKNRIQLEQERASLIGNAAITAAGVGYNSHRRASDPDIATEDLSLLGRAIRSRTSPYSETPQPTNPYSAIDSYYSPYLDNTS